MNNTIKNTIKNKTKNRINHHSINAMLLLIFAIAVMFSACNLAVNGNKNSSTVGIENYEYRSVTGNTIQMRVLSNQAIIKTATDFDEEKLTDKGFTVSEKIELPDAVYRLVYAKEGVKTNTASAIKMLKTIDGIFHVEPNSVLKLIKPVKNALNNTQSIRAIGLDSQSEGNCEYPFRKTEALTAYENYHNQTKPVLAGIIDSGVTWAHEDFGGKDSSNVIVKSKTAFSGDSITEVSKYTNHDDMGHGTHCAGIIAGKVNGKGIYGSAYKSNVKLMSYKVFKKGSKKSGSTWAVYTSLYDFAKYVADNNITNSQKTVPVNMSLGGFSTEGLAIDVVNYALSKGVLPVVAMGNEGRVIASYPAVIPGVLPVGATNQHDKIASFSSRGSWISICAPGKSILSLSNSGTDKYVSMSGTSMATPFVTGVITYLIANGGHELTPLQMRAVLEETANQVGGVSYNTDGFNTTYGYGRINVNNAVRLVKGNTVNSKTLATVKAKYKEAVFTIITSAASTVYAYENDLNGQCVASVLTTVKKGETKAKCTIRIPYFKDSPPNFCFYSNGSIKTKTATDTTVDFTN
ncbi:MAG: hypothetical protein CR988_07920 [Treponema sp.]|nr:MAG: hypothetical protein CR988_07920 [Treponema sp.]